MPRHYQPFVSQIRPTLATLPNFASELTKPAAPAVVLKYAQPDFVNQVRPTLAALPLLASADFVPGSLKAQPPRFLQCDIQMQANPTLAALPLLASSDFVPASQKSQPQVYRVCDWTSQVRPTLAMLPRIVAGTAEPAPNAQPQKYDFGGWAAPAKFGLVTQATPTIAAWTATNGSPAMVLKYARPDFVNQVAPTLATLPVSIAGLTEIAPNAQPQEFDRGSWSAPDKFGIVSAATPTVASWTANIGAPAMVLKYTRPEFVNQVAPTLATLPVSIAGLTEIAPGGQPQKFDRGSWSAPDKFGIVSAATPTVASWTSTIGQNAQPQEFDRGGIVGPDKLSASAAATPTVASWTATLGNPAVKLPVCARGGFYRAGESAAGGGGAFVGFRVDADDWADDVQSLRAAGAILLANLHDRAARAVCWRERICGGADAGGG
jgi:hypothetical protein